MKGARGSTKRFFLQERNMLRRERPSYVDLLMDGKLTREQLLLKFRRMPLDASEAAEEFVEISGLDEWAKKQLEKAKSKLAGGGRAKKRAAKKRSVDPTPVSKRERLRQAKAEVENKLKMQRDLEMLRAIDRSYLYDVANGLKSPEAPTHCAFDLKGWSANDVRAMVDYLEDKRRWKRILPASGVKKIEQKLSKANAVWKQDARLYSALLRKHAPNLKQRGSSR